MRGVRACYSWAGDGLGPSRTSPGLPHLRAGSSRHWRRPRLVLLAGERPVRGHLRQPRVPEECSQEAADLMAECGLVDPAARPTAQQVMQRLHAMLVERRHGQRAIDLS